MKPFVLIGVLCIAAAASGDEVKKPQDSPLVKAAKASGGSKKKPKKDEDR